jgi:hypothetical protein
MNQLLFSYNGVLQASANEDSVEATIYPRVAYDQLFSTEAGYESPRFSAWVSELDDHPMDNEAILGSTYQTVAVSHAVTPAVEYRVGDLKYDPTRFQIAGLREWDGDPVDQGSFATGDGSSFEYRYPYQTAGIFQVTTPMNWMGLPQLHLRYKLLYDFGHSGNIQSTDFDYLVQRSILVNIGADILTSNESDTATYPISEYRANNRIRFGVTYVF